LSYKEISKKEAYKLLYNEPKVRKPRRAHFLKVKVRVPDEGPANFFLGLILFFPIPMFIVRMVMRRFIKEEVTEQCKMPKGKLMGWVSMEGVKKKEKKHTKEEIDVRTM